MFRAHRTIVAASAIAWAVAIVLMFAPLLAEKNVRAVLMVGAVNAGALAACLTTVAVMPYLLRGMFDRAMRDHMGSFLAGWAARGERGPTEPTRLHAVR